jgi:hypothetical protein
VVERLHSKGEALSSTLVPPKKKSKTDYRYPESIPTKYPKYTEIFACLLGWSVGFWFFCFGRDGGGSVLLCNPGWPQTQDPPTSASQVRGFQAQLPHPAMQFLSLFICIQKDILQTVRFV